MSSTVRIIWKCTKPDKVHLQQFYEQLATQAAHAHGMDTAVIRNGIHCSTTLGHYANLPHITEDIVNTKKNVGYALHYNVDAAGTGTLPGTTSAPNPQLWELEDKNGKGFILVNGSDEEVHDI